jgi:hypothetical protein
MKLCSDYSDTISYIDSCRKKIFIDPSLSENGPSSALVKKDALFKTLKENHKTIVWRIGGEKNVYPPEHKRKKFPGRHLINAVYWWDGKEIIGKAWNCKSK